MKYKNLCISIFFALVTVNIVLADSQSANFPSALVVEEVFEFNSVLEGTEGDRGMLIMWGGDNYRVDMVATNEVFVIGKGAAVTLLGNFTG